MRGPRVWNAPFAGPFPRGGFGQPLKWKNQHIAVRSPMPFPSRALIAAAALAAAGAAQAATAVDLGVASQFSAITFGDFTGYGGDTGSLLGVGGNATLTNWTVNAYNVAGYSGYSFVVGGDLMATNGRINGTAGVGGTATTTNFNNPSITSTSSVLNFAQLQSQLTSTSTSTAAVASTGTVSYNANNSTFLTGTGSDVEVFSIDGSKFTAGGTYLEGLTDIKSNATVILNVSGKNINMGSFGFDLPNDGKNLNLLVNFYEATTLSFSNIAIEGAVLAPFAAVTGTSGHIGGTFIAQSFNSTGVGDFEFHDINFNPVVIPSPVPEPAEWALFGAGLLVAPMVLRRQRRREVAAAAQ